MKMLDELRSRLEEINAGKLKHQVIESLDLRTGTKSYKLYRRGTAGRAPPVATGIATRAEAEALARDLEYAP
jgi:hypothetical protein